MHRKKAGSPPSRPERTRISRSTASDPFSLALRLLGRCDHSTSRLRHKLEQRGFSTAAIDSAIARCHDHNYLNDQRYAIERTRALMRAGKGVGARVLLDLRQRGVTEEIAREALRQAEEEFCPAQLLRQELQRRFPAFRYAAANERERRRVVGFFQRRGFSLEQILSQLKQ